MYFANSGGLVQGWDISDVLNGGTHYRRVFRFWDGDETDSSIVIDPQGYLYAARHRTENVASRPIARDQQVGDLMKLDPRKPNDPLVWSVQLGGLSPEQGLLDTPAWYHGVVYTTWAEGGARRRSTRRPAKVLWTRSLAAPTWSSPVPIDGELIVGDGGRRSQLLRHLEATDHAEAAVAIGARRDRRVDTRRVARLDLRRHARRRDLRRGRPVDGVGSTHDDLGR